MQTLVPICLLIACLAGCSSLDEKQRVAYYRPLGRPFENILADEARAEVERLTSAIDECKNELGSSGDSLVDLLIERGIWKNATGNLHGAIDDFSIAISLAPSDWEPLFHRWQAYMDMFDVENAERDRKAGMKLKPKIFNTHYFSRHGGVI